MALLQVAAMVPRKPEVAVLAQLGRRRNGAVACRTAFISVPPAMAERHKISMLTPAQSPVIRVPPPEVDIWMRVEFTPPERAAAETETMPITFRSAALHPRLHKLLCLPNKPEPRRPEHRHSPGTTWRSRKLEIQSPLRSTIS